MALHAYNPSTQKAEAGGSQSQEQPELLSFAQSVLGFNRVLFELTKLMKVLISQPYRIVK